MRADIGETGLDLGNAMGILRGLGFRHQPVALGVGRQHDFDQALRAAGCFLGQPPNAPAWRHLHLAVLARDVAGDHAEQRGLAGAVAPDQADAAAGRDARGRAFQKSAAGNADGEVVDDKHARLLAERAARSKLASGQASLRKPP